MKRLLLIFILALFPGYACNDNEENPRPNTDFENAMIKYWDTETAICLAIRVSESENGRWNFRHEDRDILNEDWVKRLPHIKDYFNAYGWDIISSCGEMQVFYPTALSYGYKGSPYELRDNIYTNMKYSKKVWDDCCRRYRNMDDRVSCYNRGHSWYRVRTIWKKVVDGTNVFWNPEKIKEFYNWRYVEKTMTNYRKYLEYERI